MLFLQIMKNAQPPVYPLVGIFPDGARVEQHKVRFLGFAENVTHRFQNTRQLLGISGVHLTAEGCDMIGRGTPQLVCQRLYFLLHRFHEIILALCFVIFHCLKPFYLRICPLP